MTLLTDTEWLDSTVTLIIQLKVFRFMLQRAKEIWREKLAENYTSVDLIADKIAVQFASEIINNSRPPNQQPMHLQQILYSVCEELNVDDLFGRLNEEDVQTQLKTKVNEAIDLAIKARVFKEKQSA